MTGKLPVDLTGAPQTMLATLYGRALDAAAADPILGDDMARDLVRQLDYDWERTGITAKAAPSVTVRSAHFDTWARQFLAVHETATVLHLGSGLDTRVFRLDPGPGVEWYDVDYPDVSALAAQLLPEREHHHLLPASVTDLGWLQLISPDRPTLILAEGLTPYLHRSDGVALLCAVVDRFPSGELQFDAFNRFAIRTQKSNVVVRRAGATLHWAINGPADILRAVPGVRLLAVSSAFDADGFAKIDPVYRTVARAMSAVPVLRMMSQYHRYAF